MSGQRTVGDADSAQTGSGRAGVQPGVSLRALLRLALVAAFLVVWPRSRSSLDPVLGIEPEPRPHQG